MSAVPSWLQRRHLAYARLQLLVACSLPAAVTRLQQLVTAASSLTDVRVQLQRCARYSQLTSTRTQWQERHWLLAPLAAGQFQ